MRDQSTNSKQTYREALGTKFTMGRLMCGHDAMTFCSSIAPRVTEDKQKLDVGSSQDRREGGLYPPHVLMKHLTAWHFPKGLPVREWMECSLNAEQIEPKGQSPG